MDELFVILLFVVSSVCMFLEYIKTSNNDKTNNNIDDEVLEEDLTLKKEDIDNIKVEKIDNKNVDNNVIRKKQDINSYKISNDIYDKVLEKDLVLKKKNIENNKNNIKVDNDNISKKQNTNCDNSNNEKRKNISKEYAIPYISLEKDNYINISNKLDEKIYTLEEKYKKACEDLEDYWRYGERDNESDWYYKGFELSTKNDLTKYKNVIDSPYFGRLIVESEDGIEDLYIGQQSLTDNDLNTIVFDWRSNVCSLFYAEQVNNKIKLPDKTLEFCTILKRRIQIENKQFITASDIYTRKSNQKVYDEFLNEILKNKKKDSQFSDIIETIQSWQNDLIRADINDNILCQGVAGCGKTAIILHRLSYLLFNYPEITYDKYLILCPSELFKKNIGQLNIKLGINNIPMMTLKEYYWLKLEPVLEKKYTFSDEDDEDNDLLEENSHIDKVYSAVKSKYIEFINTKCLDKYDENEKIYKQIKDSRDFYLEKIRKDNAFEKFVLQLFDTNDSNNNLQFELLVKQAYYGFTKSDEYNSFIGKEIETMLNIEFSNSIDKEIVNKYINLYEYSLNVGLNDIGKDKLSRTLFRIYSCLVYKTYNDQGSSEQYKIKLLELLNNKIEYIKTRDIEKIVHYNNLVRACNKMINVEDFIEHLIIMASEYDEYKIKKKEINSNLLKLILFICSEFGFKIGFKKNDNKKNNNKNNNNKNNNKNNNNKNNNIIRHFKYIYIDEAQNYDNYDISIIYELESKNGLNLYGDLNQYMGKKDKEWLDIIGPLKNNIIEHKIEYNYRNTVEVVEYCNKIFKTNIKAIGPNGNPVVEKNIPNDLSELLKYENYTYITNDHNVEKYLKNNNKEVYNMNEIKGMEFNNVIVINNDMNKAEQYVSYTRTLNDLIVYK